MIILLYNKNKRTMQNYYSSLFDIMKGQATDKDKRRIFVYDSIEKINNKTKILLGCIQL